jgi:hypothetical protein
MGSSESCIRIISVRPGQRTGESTYVTEDGRSWTSESVFDSPQLTNSGGQVRGYVRDNYICNHR